MRNALQSRATQLTPASKSPRMYSLIALALALGVSEREGRADITDPSWACDITAGAHACADESPTVGVGNSTREFGTCSATYGTKSQCADRQHFVKVINGGHATATVTPTMISGAGACFASEAQSGQILSAECQLTGGSGGTFGISTPHYFIASAAVRTDATTTDTQRQNLSTAGGGISFSPLYLNGSGAIVTNGILQPGRYSFSVTIGAYAASGFSVTDPVSSVASAAYSFTIQLAEVPPGGGPAPFGKSPALPFLPMPYVSTVETDTGEVTFDTNSLRRTFICGPSGAWFGLPPAPRLHLRTGGAPFTRIDELPTGFDADGRFTITVGDRLLGEFRAGDAVDFLALTGSEVAEFTIDGISPLPLAPESGFFPLKLSFAGDCSDLSVDTKPFPPFELQPPWLEGDTLPASGGSASFTGDQLAIAGTGSGIGRQSDSVHYVFQLMTNGVEITARAPGLTGEASGGAAAGLMIRKTWAQNAPFASIGLLSSNQVVFHSRSAQEADSVETTAQGVAPPQWIKLIQFQDRIVAAYSPDLTNWTVLDAAQVESADRVYVGLYANGVPEGAPQGAVFYNISPRNSRDTKFPLFDIQPRRQVIQAGNTLTLSMKAYNSFAGALQWTLNGTPLDGATNRDLVITPVTGAHQGIYRVVFTNTDGVFSSMGAELVVESAFDGGPWEIPGRIEFENFDRGGEGVAYHDVDPQNEFGGYRKESVDIFGDDALGSYGVGSTRGSEWLQYSVHVASSGRYLGILRYASGIVGAPLRLAMDGTDLSGPIQVANTGGWDQLRTSTNGPYRLESGLHTMRFLVEGDPNSYSGNLDYIEFTPVSPLRVNATLPNPAAGVVLTVSGESGDRLLLEQSSDLSSWSPLITLTNLSGSLSYTSAPPQAPRNFYRVQVLP